MSAFGASMYESVRPTGRCAATGRPIGVGETYIATLVERPGEDRVERMDFSPEAWEAGARPAHPLLLFGFWRASTHPPHARTRTLVDDDALIDLFEQLGESTDPKRVTFRYLLALILIRKRHLRYEGTRQGRMMVRWAKAVAGGGGEPGPVIEVVDPGLSEETIADAIDQVGEVIFGADGPASAGVSPGG